MASIKPAVELRSASKATIRQTSAVMKQLREVEYTPLTPPLEPPDRLALEPLTAA